MSEEIAREALTRAKYKLSVKTKIIAAYDRAGG
jgi:ribosomal protein L16/L10AE